MHSNCLDSPIQVLACCYESCYSCRVFVYVSIMRKVVSIVVLIARIYNRVRYLDHWISRSIPIVYKPYFLSVYLIEPYCRVVSSSSSSQVPSGINWQAFIVIYCCDTFLFTSYWEFFLIVCSLDCYVECFLWKGWIFSCHIISLFFSLFLIPSHLLRPEWDMREMLLNIFISFEFSEVITRFLCDREVISKLVRFVYVPRIEEELVIHRRESLSHLFLCQWSHRHIVEVATISLCCRLYEYFAFWSYCV